MNEKMTMKKNADICSISEEEAPTESSSGFINLRQRDVPAYEKTFPEFYHSMLENGWYCKICTSF